MFSGSRDVGKEEFKRKQTGKIPCCPIVSQKYRNGDALVWLHDELYHTGQRSFVCNTTRKGMGAVVVMVERRGGGGASLIFLIFNA